MSAPEKTPLIAAIERLIPEIAEELYVLPCEPPSRDQMLEPRHLAALLSVSPRTLESWRREGRGPRVTKVEGAVRYRYGDVLEWIATQNPQIGDETAPGRPNPRSRRCPARRGSGSSWNAET